MCAYWALRDDHADGVWATRRAARGSVQLGRQLPLSSDSAPSGDSDVADRGPLF